MKRWRKQQSAAYMKICALLVPKEFKVERSASIAPVRRAIPTSRAAEFERELITRPHAGRP